MELGLIGKTLIHSRSPEIHEELFRLLGEEGHHYTLMEWPEDAIERNLELLYREGFTGINVTIPYKRAVMPYLRRVSDEARSIGAVNTILFKGDGMYGYNTDYTGFGKTLESMGEDVSGERCVVLGTGGAARAVIQYLADAGAAEIAVASRHPEHVDQKFQSFLDGVGALMISYAELDSGGSGAGDRPVSAARLLVNCTPVGMFPKVGIAPVSERVVARFAAVVDLIYNPEETLLLKMAREQRKKTRNGMYMLVAQAMASEEIWRDEEIPEQLVRSVAATMGENKNAETE